MDAEQLWEIYCNRNPQFREEGARITMPVRGLKKFFQQTWDIAYQEGRGCLYPSHEEKKRDEGFDIFSTIFGR